MAAHLAYPASLLSSYQARRLGLPVVFDDCTAGQRNSGVSRCKMAQGRATPPLLGTGPPPVPGREPQPPGISLDPLHGRILCLVTTLTLAADGAQVLVSVRERSGPNGLLYFGGNAEDVSYNLPSLSTAFSDYAIYLMHYRGYGGSSGKPSEAALVADALALFDKVNTEHQNITVVGRSLGSGVAVHLASLRPVAVSSSSRHTTACKIRRPTVSILPGPLVVAGQVRATAVCATDIGPDAHSCGRTRRRYSTHKYRDPLQTL